MDLNQAFAAAEVRGGCAALPPKSVLPLSMQSSSRLPTPPWSCAGLAARAPAASRSAQGEQEPPDSTRPRRRNPGPLGGTGVSTFRQMVELVGLEPTPFRLPAERSPN